MGAIPTSDLPGHRHWGERADFALDKCQESQGVDFKESLPWDEIRPKVIRAALAMGNLRDGGLLIIGASERSSEWNLTGISEEHLGTYSVDDVIDQVNTHISPTVEIDVVTHEYRRLNLRFLVIGIREFSDIPLVCRKSLDAERLFAGDILVRPPGKPESRKIRSAQELHDLIELAAEKRARMILERGRRVGLVATNTSKHQFEAELEGL